MSLASPNEAAKTTNKGGVGVFITKSDGVQRFVKVRVALLDYMYAWLATASCAPAAGSDGSTAAPPLI
jgi:hypothetical protein